MFSASNPSKCRSAAWLCPYSLRKLKRCPDPLAVAIGATVVGTGGDWSQTFRLEDHLTSGIIYHNVV